MTEGKSAVKMPLTAPYLFPTIDFHTNFASLNKMLTDTLASSGWYKGMKLCCFFLTHPPPPPSPIIMKRESEMADNFPDDA